MRARVETLLGADCSRHVGVDVPLALRAPAAPRGAGHRPLARLRHLRLVRPADGRQAGAEGAADRRQLRPAARGALAHQPARRTGWRARRRSTASAGWNRRDEQIAKIYALLPAARSRRATRSTSTTCCSRPSSSSRQSEHVRAKYAGQFRFVMVDEYQDTNRPQYLLIRRLAEVHRNLCVVGDPGSVDLQVARRRPAEHPRLRAGLPRGHDRQARAQLPLDADHPRRRVGGHQPEPQPQGEAPLDRPRGRRPHRLLPRRRRARGGRLHHAHGARRAGRRRRRPRSRCCTAPTRSRARLKTR